MSKPNRRKYVFSVTGQGRKLVCHARTRGAAVCQFRRACGVQIQSDGEGWFKGVQIECLGEAR